MYQRGRKKFFEDDLIFGVEIPGLVRKDQRLSSIEGASDGIPLV